MSLLHWFHLPTAPNRIISRRWARRLTVAVAGVVLSGTPLGAEETPRLLQGFAGPDLTDMPEPYRMHRLVRHFSFEEAEVAPYEMPLHFFRYGAEDGAARGFPPFGAMRLSDRMAATGRWSFEFQLDGGSMAARVPTAVIPIMPYADYVVTARVRTKDLQQARAGLSAWLYNKQGAIIQPTIQQSRMIRSEGEWSVLAVTVRGDHPTAADLGIELQTFQPRQFRGISSGEHQPAIEDVRGTVWFDDVTVWHVPRIELTTRTPGHVAIDTNQTVLQMKVRDLAHADLEAHLRIFDLDGSVIWEKIIDRPQAINPRDVEIETPAFGWYRALLDIRTEGQLTARRWLDFLVLPPRHRPLHGWHNHFAVELPPDWWKHSAELNDLVDRLDVGTVIMPVLDTSLSSREVRSRYESMRPAVEALREHDARLIFSLHSMPAELAQRHDRTVSEVLPALADDVQMWRAYLDQLLVNYGLEVEHWQIGAADNEHAFDQPNLAQLIRRVRRTISEFVPNPTVYVPFSVEQVETSIEALQAASIWIPATVNAHSIPEAVEPWQQGAQRRMLAVEPPIAHHYATREATLDGFLRLLHAWRMDPDLLTTPAPWMAGTGNGGGLMPTPNFGVIRQMIDHLHRRRFDGTVHLGDQISGWLLRGDEPGDDALIAWLHDLDPAAERRFTMQLSDDHLTIFDIFGNSQTAYLTAEGHEFTLTPMPIIIEDVSLDLVRFRDSFALDPGFLPAENRAHEHELLLHNPWPVPISGTLRLHEQDDLRIAPRQHDFLIRPGETGRMPVQIVLDRGILAGTRHLKADIRLQADGQYDLSVSAEFEVGLEDLEFTATWRTALNVETGEEDLIVTQYVTNRSERLMNVELFVVAPEFSQMRRIVSGLEPGDLAIRSFRLPDGAAVLAGRAMRIGVSERGGVARLNQLLSIPARASDLAGHTETTD